MRLHRVLIRVGIIAFGVLVWSPAEGEPTHKTVPGVVVDHSPRTTGIYIGSPSLAVLPDGTYVASHDEFGPGSTEHERAKTRVFISKDRGESWQHVADVEGQFWSTLFVHRGHLYLLGTWSHYGNLVIRRSQDGGRTWTSPDDEKSGLLAKGRFHCAPVPVVEHSGRIWRAVEDTTNPRQWGRSFRARVISAPTDADLLVADNWTLSNPLPGDSSWLDGGFGGFLEGNIVIGPAGEILNILRVAYPEGGKAAVLHVARDGRTLRFDPHEDFVDFPGGAKKFTIRFDPQSRRYWSLVNWVPPRHQGLDAARVRNTLALVASPDLRHWEIRTVLLYHSDTQRHAFQYPDWLFDGDDIIAAIRTAYDDEAGGAHNAHDANYLTFHRFKCFRDLTMRDSVVPPAELGLQE
ncbi:sialidase family protein [Thermogutta terrifontis]|uniref:sialidase family protein n=1 Tax=Thermogutta terrifontis TaxID=1331910 RepID=UPI000BA85FB9|nr:sialidase family protein [Thermogutta terrifontis]